MTTFLIIIVVIISFLCAYLGVGITIAKGTRRAIIAAASHGPGDTYQVRSFDSYETRTYTTSGVNRYKVRELSYRMIFGWPVHAWWFFFNRDLRRDLDQADPELTARRIQASEQWLSEQLREVEQ